MVEIVLKDSPSKGERKYLQARFINLCQKLGLALPKAKIYYEELSQLYNDPNRYYHNLVHLFNFLKLLDQHVEEIDQVALFEMAIWYHDAIYDAKKKDNELQSALLVQQLFREYLKDDELAYINKLIMSTAGHYPKSEEQDVYFFLDFDLAILATDHKNYQFYSEAIWKEYKKFYPKLLYKMGRKKVLKGFLRREKIYFSQLFFEKYEKKARQNIQLELNGK
ncbi:HD domain-containing protein [Aureispira anguillae]|uniref:Metal-dependent HD superfamily phosphohydrolase n=1 Tax=Aureispira anguillae TaxID=2864201 RepID=A0A916DUC9_9BACT|nr:hypothetical protein [Aureispira anguillae]BDS13236.1 hypothetical protein AsAng_0039660 [Aureispira anguillae]